MKTYKTIDEFIEETFPGEHQILIKQESTKIERSIEHIDSLFENELETILKGEKQEAKK